MLQVSKDMSIVGGRTYTTNIAHSKQASAKMYFVKTTMSGIQELQQTIDNGEKDRNNAWRNELASIRSFDLLDPKEKTMGFADKWTGGLVEIVLHPMGKYADEALKLFCEETGLREADIRTKAYLNGATFIAAQLTAAQVTRVSRINPLRTLHPLGRVSLVPVRSDINTPAPSIESYRGKPVVNVGVFDGGCAENAPLLKEYIATHDCVSAPHDAESLSHGTGVCGAVLHGNLANVSSHDVLPLPNVFVESFRVLPVQDSADFELYEAIEAIEKVVPKYPDIGLFNISFGPCGPVLDDNISRFTYAIDRLSFREDGISPLFCVAVGNDGEMPTPFNRIQSPADAVNGLGVGAYAYDGSHKRVQTDYSCVGPGREGGKIKPDLLEFGGSHSNPFIVIDAHSNVLARTCGTSFASPLAVHKLGTLLSNSEDISPHLARALLIHNTEGSTDHDKDTYGFGFSPDNIDDCLDCDETRVTTLYQGLLHQKETVRLPIFAPRINDTSGNAKITWTIVAVSNVDINDSDAYTASCVLDVFMPHAMKFSFTKAGCAPVTVNLLDPGAIDIKDLLDRGYKQSMLPVSRPSKRNWRESDLRATDFKWDTLIHKSASMRGSSLLQPALSLQSIFRNNDPEGMIEYYVAVTVDAPKYPGSLYNDTLQQYRHLAPIRLREENRITQ
jgi:hypothetical protein